MAGHSRSARHRCLESKGRYTARGLLALGALLLLGAAPAPASGQLMVGGHIAQAREVFGGATGIGVRAGLVLPLVPVEAFAGGEYFFPGCPGVGGCGWSGLSLDGNVRLPFPLLNPYMTGGWVLRRYDPPGGGEIETQGGLHLGLGIGGGLPGVRIFGEARYEFVRAPERQFVLRLGLLRGG